MREYASPANAMTSVGLVTGFAAVLLAFEGRLGWAAAAIAVAAVLDLLDGPVARRAAGEDRFGAELDSLTDLLAFAVAPAVLLYEAAASAPRADSQSCTRLAKRVTATPRPTEPVEKSTGILSLVREG